MRPCSVFSARCASSARKGLTATSFKFRRLPLKSTDAGGVGCTTRKPPGGSAEPEAQVEKYHPITSGSTMNTTRRSGFDNALRASRSRRIGVTNSSQNACEEETYSRIATSVVTTYQLKVCPGIG